MSQNGSWKAVPRSYRSAAAAAEYTQEQATGELLEQCLLQLVLSLTAPYLCAWCPQELKNKHILSPYAQVLGTSQRASTGAVERICLG